VEFGYDTDLHCTKRAEACVANRAGVDESTPFYWAGSDSYSGLACASGCTVTVPAVPQRVVYYRLKYRDSSNTVRITSRTQVAVAP
jgi:hypothetical protein